MNKIKIISSGNGLPRNKVSHFDFDIIAQLELGTSLNETRIKNRYMSTTETATDLAFIASNEALKNSKLSLMDIDLLVVASATMDKALPFNAALLNAKLQEEYKEKHYFQTMDIGASCLSFITALDTVSYMLQSGKYKKALIVSSDVSTYCLDYKDIKSNGIFGDGAAAMIVEKGDEISKIIASEFITLPEGVDYCQINSGGSRFHRRKEKENHANAVFEMNGKKLFGLALKFMPKFLDNLLMKANLTIDDIDVIIHHGGSGIMYECIKYGKPSIVFPQDYDQFDNAARIEYANLGVRVKNFKDVIVALEKIQKMDNFKYFLSKYQKILVNSNPINSIIEELDN